jgi:tetratricopeptide (TPR) repeat protein
MRVSLADALIRTSDLQAAQTELRAAIRVDPSLASAHFLLGVLLEGSGRLDEAVVEYTTAVTQNPRFREGHLRLATALRRMDRPEEALSSYRRVLEIDPAADEARLGEAVMLARLSRDAEARDRLHAAMALHPEQPAFTEAMARLLAASPDQSVRDGQRALDLVQALAATHKTTSVAETMAMALAELGRFAEAAEWQRLAIAVATDAGRSDAAARMGANLALYERHEPCRTPWREDDLNLDAPPF